MGRPGRPPKGDRAMTAAERQRLRRERLRQAEPSSVRLAREAAKAAKAAEAKPDASAELIAARAEIKRLRAEIAALKAGHPAPEVSPEPKPAKSYDRQAAGERVRAMFEADARERAQWGGRSKSMVEADIRRLLSGHRLSDRAMETITSVMLRHIDRDQADIERGIPRRTYRKVLADLSPDRTPGNEAEFIAFKALDVKKGGKSWHTIVIPDDKVKTMSDYRRKREERSEKAKAAAAKRAKR